MPLSDIPPIYVYLSQGRSGIPDKDLDYHPAPETSEIGISGLKQAKKKTPKQSGGGLRERRVDAKGRRIYEWNSQHGELEEYRASDGEHLGTIDYKTGEQLKSAVKGRNIKRYLYEEMMGLKLILEWFNKNDGVLISKETSVDLGQDGSIIKKFNLPFDGRIYDGGFDVLIPWKDDLQPLFLHHIDFEKYDYQLVFKRSE